MSFSLSSVASFFLPFPYLDTLNLPVKRDQNLLLASSGIGILALGSGLLRLVKPLPATLTLLVATSITIRCISQITIRQAYDSFCNAIKHPVNSTVSEFDMHLARISPALMRGLHPLKPIHPSRDGSIFKYVYDTKHKLLADRPLNFQVFLLLIENLPVDPVFLHQLLRMAIAHPDSELIKVLADKNLVQEKLLSCKDWVAFWKHRNDPQKGPHLKKMGFDLPLLTPEKVYDVMEQQQLWKYCKTEKDKAILTQQGFIPINQESLQTKL